jgi:hypothetical protein
MTVFHLGINFRNDTSLLARTVFFVDDMSPLSMQFYSAIMLVKCGKLSEVTIQLICSAKVLHPLVFGVWTLDFLERCSDLEATAMVVTMSHIWDARNRFPEGEPMMHPRSVAKKTLAYIQMIVTHLYKPSTSHRRESKSSVLKWSSSPAGMVFVNVDASIFSASRWMGVGVAIRDHNGVCLTACSEYQEEALSLEIAEALALRRAINLAKDEVFTKIIINSDCLSVVNRVYAVEDDRSLCGPVIHDIRKLMPSFTSCSVKHFVRGLNVAAHTLAKLSETLGYVVWRGVSLDCIREILYNDIMIM